MVYATPNDYRTWTGEEPPDGIFRILEVASLMVDRALTRPILVLNDATDEWETPDPLPAATAEALKKATCAQAWAVEEGGLEGVESVSIGSLSITAKEDAPKAGLTDAARAYLLNAGLLYRGVMSGERPRW